MRKKGKGRVFAPLTLFLLLTHLIFPTLLLLNPINIEQNVPHPPPDTIRNPLVHPVDHLLAVLGRPAKELLLLLDHLGPLEAASDLLLDVLLVALAAAVVREAAVTRIGEKIMNYLIEISKKRGCYKTILDCTDDVKPFYEKLGFRKVASELRLDNN